MLRSCVLASLVASAHGTGELTTNHSYVEGGTSGFEWGGIFPVHAGEEYQWLAQKVTDSSNASIFDYADPAMQIVILEVPVCTEEQLHALEGLANYTFFYPGCTDKTVGMTLTPGETCTNLVFDATAADSRFKIASGTATCLAIYAQHYPTEFERDTHYLKDIGSGDDVEPLHQIPESAPAPAPTPAPAEDKPWGQGIGAALCVNIVTFFGVILLVPAVGAAAKKCPRTRRSCPPPA